MKPITAFPVALCILAGAAGGASLNPSVAVPFFFLAALASLSFKMATVWEKFVVSGMGKLQGVKGAGLRLFVSGIDTVIAVIDGRRRATAFDAEQALTRDTVPVNVDAIIFWRVEDAGKPALAITNHREAIDRVARTCLRETTGSSMLAARFSGREDADEQLENEIARAGRRTSCPARWWTVSIRPSSWPRHQP